MSWDVVVTTNAPEYVVQHFVNVYKALGVHEIHIFYDDPAAAVFLNLNGVRETSCTTDYWNGRRPSNIERRQLENARFSAKLSDATWMLQCDIDEHLFVHGTVQQALETLPENCSAAIIRPIEAVYLEPPNNFFEVFSTPWFKTRKLGFSESKSFWRARYGELVSISNAGFWAHGHGKPFVKISAIRPAMRFPLHAYRGELAKYHGQRQLNGVLLRHYDAQPLSFWAKKHISRLNGAVIAAMMGGKRERQAQMIREAVEQGEHELHNLFRFMYCISSEMLVAGVNNGAITTIPPLSLPSFLNAEALELSDGANPF